MTEMKENKILQNHASFKHTFSHVYNIKQNSLDLAVWVYSTASFWAYTSPYP